MERDWQEWLTSLFASHVGGGFAAHHADFWAWIWAIQRGVRPSPFVAIWPRGGAKSSSAELAAVAIGARGVRSYAWYLCGTQEQSDDHVANIGALLETSQLGRYYPDMAARMVGKFGNPKGWRRNRLRTAAGFTVDAIGLDTAARGGKLEDHRPDFIIIDDIDGELDSIATVEKKIKTLTTKILPAGSVDLAVLAVQNLIHSNSVFARFADGRADFLADRIVSGPHPAIVGMTYEDRGGRYVVTGGVPTWAGQDLARCQAMIDDFGLSAFLTECQHEVDVPDGGMFSHLTYQYCNWEDVPTLEDVQVWCDPAVTNTDNSDSHGMQADGRHKVGKGADGRDVYRFYRLYSWEGRTTPQDVLKRALRKAIELKASCVGVETDQGGLTWQSVYNEAWRALVEDPDVPEITAATPRPTFKDEKAGAGHGPKTHRASQMLTAYENGQFVHVLGTHEVLERALKRFPKTKPYDLVDAAYWSWYGVANAYRGQLFW